MANPQKDNGFTAIANEIMEAVYSRSFTAAEMAILLVVIRYTYGFQKKEAALSLSFIAQATGLHKYSVHRIMKKFKTENIIFEKKPATATQATVIALNKNYDSWGVCARCDGTQASGQSTRGRTVNSQVDGESTCELTGESTCECTNKENIKKNIKKCASASHFALFWEAYPKKKDKAKAKKAFEKIKANDELLEKMLAAIQEQKLSDQWQEKQGQFIPYPSSWLNGERWNDVEEVDDVTRVNLIDKGGGAFQL